MWRSTGKMNAVRGSCLCGAVQFAIAPPYAWFANCHCSMCRKHHGALYSSSLGVARERFEWLAGTNEIVRYSATGAFERPFCRRCGSTVPGLSQDASTLNVPAGLLERLNAGPRRHIFVGSKSPLTEIADGLPQDEGYPPGSGLQPPTRPHRVGEPQPLAQTRAQAGACSTGSCLCGAVAYGVEGALERLEHCACALCRRRTGSSFSTSALVAALQFRWLRGVAFVAIFRGPAPHAYSTAFCANCGGLLPVASAGRAAEAVAAVPAGALDTIAPAHLTQLTHHVATLASHRLR